MTSRTRLTGLALLALVALGSADHAFAYCSKPSAPSCVSRYGAFNDQWEFDRCKREIENFKDETESFMSCNNDEAQEAISKANSENQSASAEYSDAVSSFNRRARSN
ncbi:hypothetical protein [Agrobacterium rosae]